MDIDTTDPAPGPITRLLGRLRDGDHEVLDELLPLVYGELRHIAHVQRPRDSGRTPTLDTTALVHEAYLRLARREGAEFEHRRHFYAVAAMAMRQIVVDEARRRLRQKRGAGDRPVLLDDHDLGIDSQAEFLLSLDEALDALAGLNPRLRQVVECRYFAGLTECETAEALDVNHRTVRRDWAKARAWLGAELGMVGS